MAAGVIVAGMMVSMGANAAETATEVPAVPRATSTPVTTPASATTSSASTTSASKGSAAGITTASAASAGGLTATVVAVGVAAVVIGVALSDTGGGDDNPAPPVTNQQ
ncbi:hypothetical protein KY46_01095 [Photobacterium halotolerans]|uniref:Uncharacterized protein n=2 Tax=Photobacterium halotolerans TaxID=265726 RepID=A0A0F5VIV9_9GAMM|nr:hypothetical protein KY46_01095 [Photobacterium halotolerans]